MIDTIAKGLHRPVSGSSLLAVAAFLTTTAFVKRFLPAEEPPSVKVADFLRKK